MRLKPNKYVFPGGAWDKVDTDVPFVHGLSDYQKKLLRLETDFAESSYLGITAIRELWEETGIEAEMGPVIWTQQVQFTFGPYFFDNDEKIHIAWCDGGEYQPKHLEALEAAAFIEAQWWSVEDLLSSDFPVLPERLREFFPDLTQGNIPSTPIDISPKNSD